MARLSSIIPQLKTGAESLCETAIGIDVAGALNRAFVCDTAVACSQPTREDAAKSSRTK